MRRRYWILLSILVVALIIYLKRDVLFVPRYLGDLHVHTTCSDGKNTYEEVIEAATKARLKFIAITDHKICKESFEKCKTESRIFCIPSQEVTPQRTHILALNITSYINPHQELPILVEEIHKQGGFAVAAHPNSKDYLYTDNELTKSGFDAMECSNDPKERRPLPCVYDSDAHKVSDIAWQSNSCLGKINNFEDLKNAILSKKCSRSISLSMLSRNQSLRW